MLVYLDINNLGISMFYIFNLYLSIGLFLFAAYRTLKSKNHSKQLSALSAFFALIFITMTNIYIVSNYFTGVGFNEAVIYHLSLDTLEGSIIEYINIILVSIVIILATIFITYKINKKKCATKFSVIIFLLAIFTSPLTYNLYRLAKPSEFKATDLKLNEKGEGQEIVKLTNKKNLIIIYAEGFERTYLRDDIFPGMTPRMRELENNSISFTDMHTALGTEWTIAGVVSSQCGIPLVAAGGYNSMSGILSFYPSAICLPDVLSSNGYVGIHIQGSSITFSGTENYLKTHKYNLVKGKAKLKEEYPTNRTSSWGFYDKNILDDAKLMADSLSKKESPFYISIGTMDTHHPRGHVFPSCKIGHKDGDSRLVKAFKCSEHYIYDFIQQIRKSKYSKDTIITIISDHLSTKNILHDKLVGLERRNLFLINFHDNARKEKITKPGTHFDIATTILSLLGGDYKIGLGTNLLSNEKGVYEKYGKKLNDYLRGMNKNFIKLWSFPTDNADLEYKDELITVGKNEFKTPLVLTFDKNAVVNPIYYYYDTDNRLTNHIKSFSPDQAFMWFDECDTIKKYFTLTDSYSGQCFLYGKLGGELKLTSVSDKSRFSHKEIIEISNQSITQGKFKNYEKILALKINETQRALIDSTAEGDVIQLQHPLPFMAEVFKRKIIKANEYAPTFYRYIKKEKRKKDGLAIIDNKIFEVKLVLDNTSTLKRIHNFFKKLLYVVINKDFYPTISGVQKLTLKETLVTPEDYFTQKDRFIAHAAGKVDGHIYTNSLEAANVNYANGFRLFEFDLTKTSDGHIVASHDWESWKSKTKFKGEIPPTLKDFKSYKLHGKYTPLTIEDIKVWFEKHPDAILVTDKIKNPKEVLAKFPYKDRLMIEVFDEATLKEGLSLGLNVMPTSSLFIKLINRFEKEYLGKVKAVAISRNELARFVEKIQYFSNKGLKFYAYHLNYKPTKSDETYVVCNELTLFYGVYADQWDFEVKNCSNNN